MPLPRDSNNNIVQAPRLGGVSYDVSAGTPGPAIAATTRFLRLAAVTDARVIVAATGTAGAASSFLKAGAIDYVAAHEGERVSATGTINVTECS
jgi:hypothetical protein